MSGIAGILRFDGTPVEPGLVQTMIASMAHRGPDGSHVWLGESAALGHCMLRTTPESLEENQPLASEDQKRVLVMDGRVDNWEELRRELLHHGTVLRNRSDAELVLRAYETWGKECLAHIDGDFAFVIWDNGTRTAFCARDRIGHKPFHYHWDGRTFTFASEPQAILAMPWIRQVPNEGMLAEYLAAEWHSRDETFWVGVMRLVAAHRMTVGAGEPRPECYWEPDLWAVLPYKRDEEYFEHYRELLTENVRRASRSHRPVAYHVSGGLDSSAVFCVAHRLQQQGRLPAPAIQGRTLAFPGERLSDELFYSRAVGRYLGVMIHEDPPTRLLPRAWYADRVKATKSYPGESTKLMFLGLMQAVSSQGGRVIVTGLGGDDWLATVHHAYYDEGLAQRDWRQLRRSLFADARAHGAATALYWLLRHGAFQQLPEPIKMRLRWLKARTLRLRPGRRDSRYWLAPHMRRLLDQRRALPWHTHSQPLRTAGQKYLLFRLYEGVYEDMFREHDDRLAALLGLEERNPMASARQVQFAFSTPDHLRQHGSISKFIHVRALQNLLPAEVLERRSKADFSALNYEHVDQWLAALTREMPQKQPDWVTHEGMAALRRAYESDAGRNEGGWLLWCLYVCDLMGEEMQQAR